MSTRLQLGTILLFGLLFLGLLLEAKKSIDPYKVLGVERDASQRDIKKSFHKLSLQYHPDKNKNKGAQEKFEEINNAYEILSDEQKRKNYDLYGDAEGRPSFDAGTTGDHGGYSYSSSGGSGASGFNFRPGDWQNMGSQGGSKSFSFSFGGPSGGNSFGFGLDDIFSNFFGGSAKGGADFGGFGGSSGFGGFSGSGGSQSGAKTSPKSIRPVNSQVFEKEINDRGVTWLLLTYAPSMQYQQYESVLEGVASTLKGVLKVGKINCEKEKSFCKSHAIHLRRSPRLFVYSYIKSEGGSFVEYNDDWDVKRLKSFCLEHLPRFSKRVHLNNFEPSSYSKLPQLMLLSTKKDTPLIWRALSGLYRKRFIFYDSQVHDVSGPKLKKWGVDALPAIVGWLSNGEQQVLKTGILVKDMESTIQGLSRLLDSFEKKNKMATKKPKPESSDKVPILSASNWDSVCGDKSPVCVIGAFRSSKSKDTLESLLSMVSQKSLSRHSNPSSSSPSKDSVSYAILDASKHQSFLSAFEKSGFKSSDKFLLAYKPRREKYAVLTDDVGAEEVETFISEVLSGDIQFKKTRQKPVIR